MMNGGNPILKSKYCMMIFYIKLQKMQTDLQTQKSEARSWDGWEGRITDSPEETFWGNGYVHCGDDSWVCTCVSGTF